MGKKITIGLASSKSTVASRNASTRFTESIRFAKSGSQTIAPLPNRKIRRLAIMSRCNRRVSRSIDSYPSPSPPLRLTLSASHSLSLTLSFSFYPLFTTGKEEIFHGKEVFLFRSPFVIYSCVLIMWFVPPS